MQFWIDFWRAILGGLKLREDPLWRSLKLDIYDLRADYRMRDPFGHATSLRTASKAYCSTFAP
jgi:hypothetical protein